MFSSANKYDTKSTYHHKLTRSVINFICKAALPVYTVEKEGFKSLLEAFDPQYALPSRSYFSKTAITKLYNEVSGRLRDSLSNIDYYSCTTDLWSSHTTDPYMSLTIHYIENWELQSKFLQVLYTPQDHTSENLKDALQDSLDKWNLDPSKLVAFTTDNGANIVKACQLAGIPRFQCFGRRLNLAVTNSIKDDPRVRRVIGVC
ncbi:hypothetical protein NP493_65g01022 [Ridgeia piscesae]|uniref:Uncharacterized protein n=1 Tax=Ridgeia piscesae TaxID=27915 RepID=A0AAD9PA02_RIDPI|nr:hypothetical protein NP493_65g01022 [Ridgeia piscesae]